LPEESVALFSYFQKAVGFGREELAVTVSAMVVVWTSEPFVPVTVTVDVPVVAVLLAVRVSVEDDVEDVGLKTAVTPLGRPLAVNATLPVKPLMSDTLIVLAPFEPCAMERLDGLAERLKLGVEPTVNEYAFRDFTPTEET